MGRVGQRISGRLARVCIAHEFDSMELKVRAGPCTSVSLSPEQVVRKNNRHSVHG